MTSNLFLQLEEKVEHAVETIELLRLQIEELEEENIALKAEHEKWRDDLSSLIGRLDNVDLSSQDEEEYEEEQTTEAEEEDFVTA